jgi:hypothetical protein
LRFGDRSKGAKTAEIRKNPEIGRKGLDAEVTVVHVFFRESFLSAGEENQ